MILFWQFAISSLEEIDIVSNQHLSIEMFLIRLMHLSSIKFENKIVNATVNLNNENIHWSSLDLTSEAHSWCTKG